MPNILHANGTIGLKPIDEGNHHHIYIISVLGSPLYVARASKEPTGGALDTDSFGVPRSLEREVSSLELFSSLGAPHIHSIHREGYPFSLVELIRGYPWAVSQQNAGYSLEHYLRTMRTFGESLAGIHGMQFDKYGSIGQGGQVVEGEDGFYPKIEKIYRTRSEFAQKKNGEHGGRIFTEDELRKIDSYFGSLIGGLEQLLTQYQGKPVLVIDDLHPMQIMVSEDGQIKYPDLEICLAAHPAMDMYWVRKEFFTWHDETAYHRAEQAFFEGYMGAGGNYSPDNELNKKLEQFLFAVSLLSQVAGYYGEKGFRSDWSSQLKAILMNIVNNNFSGIDDFIRYGNVIRSKTRQPVAPR